MGDEVWKQSHWTANVDYVWPKRSLFWSFLDYPFMFFFVCVTPFDFHRSFISGVMWVKQRHKPAIWEWFISLYHLSIVIWGMVYGIVLPTWYLLTIDFIRIFLTYLWIFILVLPTLDFLQLNSSIFFPTGSGCALQRPAAQRRGAGGGANWVLGEGWDIGKSLWNVELWIYPLVMSK